MKTLQELIAEFLEANPTEWDTARKAFCACDTASYGFVDFCKSRGCGGLVAVHSFECPDETKNPDPVTYCLGVHPELGLPKASWHCIVVTADCFIDWTARQYDASRPYPYIIPKQQALAAKA